MKSVKGLHPSYLRLSDFGLNKKFGHKDVPNFLILVYLKMKLGHAVGRYDSVLGVCSRLDD